MTDFVTITDRSETGCCRCRTFRPGTESGIPGSGLHGSRRRWVRGTREACYMQERHGGVVSMHEIGALDAMLDVGGGACTRRYPMAGALGGRTGSGRDSLIASRERDR
ncbi:hypothetical protein C8Q80DRAFT_1215107, partial [Daedaleopsis nitida]